MKRIFGLILVLAVTGGFAVASQARTGGGHDGNPYTVVMSGLDNPRGLTFAGPGEDRYGEGSRGESALYVAEAGAGGTLRCTTIRGGKVCVGLTGAVSRYSRGHQERVVEGLPSYAPFNAANAGAVGPSDISFADGRGYVSIGLAANLSLPVELGEKFGWIAHFDRHGTVTYDVDVSAYEGQANPDQGPLESNPYGLLAGAGKRVVADAAANTLLRVSASNSISTLACSPLALRFREAG